MDMGAENSASSLFVIQMQTSEIVRQVYLVVKSDLKGKLVWVEPGDTIKLRGRPKACLTNHAWKHSMGPG